MLAAQEVIIETGCVNTFYNQASGQWYWLDSSVSMKTCLYIDENMVITDDEDPWAYKLRVVIYPNCEGLWGESASRFFSLNISCVGCNCDFCECEGSNCPDGSSSSSSSSSDSSSSSSSSGDSSSSSSSSSDSSSSSTGGGGGVPCPCSTPTGSGQSGPPGVPGQPPPYTGQPLSMCNAQGQCSGSGSSSISTSGACLRVYALSLDGLEFLGDPGERALSICMSYVTYSLRDRIMVLASKGQDQDETNLLRSHPFPDYGELVEGEDACPETPSEFYLAQRPFNTPPHPFLGNDEISAPENSIIHDTGCVAQTQQKKVVLTITENHVEIDNTEDEWFKLIRVFIFAGCDSSQNATATQYDIEFSPDISSCTRQLTMASCADMSEDPWFRCSYAVTTSVTPPPATAGVVHSRDGRELAYAESCCAGGETICQVDFRPNFSNAADMGCAEWSLERQCNIDGVTHYFWRPVIRSCAHSSDGCGVSGDPLCPPSCNTCCMLCFAVGTRILMWDGTTRLVEELAHGDVVAGVVFGGGGSSSPTFTDLLSGWSAPPMSFSKVNASVTQVSLGYEKGRATVGGSIVVSPEHPILVQRKDERLAFVSASMIKQDNILVMSDGRGVAAGSVLVTDDPTISVFLQLDVATAVVANGIICHVGTSAGKDIDTTEHGFTINMSQVSQQNMSQINRISGTAGYTKFFKFNGEAVSKCDLASLPKSARGLVESRSSSECQSECINCSISARENCSTGDREHFILYENFGAVPCCHLDAFGSQVFWSGLSVDNGTVFQAIAVEADGVRGIYLVARKTDQIATTPASILYVGESPSGNHSFHEPCEISGVTVVPVVSADGSTIMCFGFDGESFSLNMSFSPNSGSITSYVPVFNSLRMEMLLLVNEEQSAILLSNSQGQFVEVWSTTPDESPDSVVCMVMGDGSVHVLASRGDGVLHLGNLRDDPLGVGSVFAGSSGGTWKLLGARDGASCVGVWISDAQDIDGMKDVMVAPIGMVGPDPVVRSALKHISKISHDGEACGSGLQGRFLLGFGGVDKTYEYDLASGSVHERMVCSDTVRVVSCSKSHDLVAMCFSDITRCQLCNGENSGGCNTGGVILGGCGSICSGKLMIPTCSS